MEKLIKGGLIGIFVQNILDVLSTYFALRTGRFYEANHIFAWLFDTIGFFPSSLIKLGVTLSIILLLFHCWKHSHYLQKFWFFATIYFINGMYAVVVFLNFYGLIGLILISI